MDRADSADYRSIFLRDTPLIDTRAPVEFARGAFPGSVNLPLMNDDERHQVGIRYKEAGQEAAIELGQRLVSADLKQQRVAAWCQFAGTHPDGYIYCFRGGLRSQTARQWMRDAGVDYPLVLGGYKAMRRFLIEELERATGALRLVLVAGKTGTGKTRVIDALPGAIDLEGLANHRGSSFGRLLEDQPTQIAFENALAVALLRHRENHGSPLLLEDEGKLIGRLGLPDALREKMQAAPLLVVEEPLASRVQVILEDYVIDLGRRYASRYGDEGCTRHQRHLRDGLARIQRRLGGALYQQIDELVLEAFQLAGTTGELGLHRQWIELLLVKYYDPMYDYQMSRREGEILARARRADIIAQAKALGVDGR